MRSGCYLVEPIGQFRVVRALAEGMLLEPEDVQVAWRIHVQRQRLAGLKNGVGSSIIPPVNFHMSVSEREAAAAIVVSARIF